MWPFVWRQCLGTTPRSRSSSAHVHVSSEVDAHLRLGFGPARGLGAGAVLLRRCCDALASAAAASAALSADSAWALLAFGLVTARQAASAAQRCRSPRWRSIDKRATVASSGRPSFQLLFLPLLCVLSLGPKVKPGLQRLRRLSCTRFGMDQRVSRGVQKILECYIASVFHSQNCHRIGNYAGTTNF